MMVAVTCYRYKDERKRVAYCIKRVCYHAFIIVGFGHGNFIWVALRVNLSGTAFGGV